MPKRRKQYGNQSRLVTDIIERRNESRKWMRKNLYDEMTEVWRAIKCKTPPIFKKDRAGNETTTEDKSRTNVAMPDLNIIYRRNAARMTASPYRLRYTGGDDPGVADALSDLAMKQFARSNEAFQDVRLVLASEAFGWGYTKLYWDTLVRTMTFRKALMKGKDVVYRDRASIMRYQGASNSEVDQAVDEFGAEMDDDEIARFMAKSGTEVNVPQELRQYDGPMVKWIFNGDLYIEPNCRTLDLSSYIIEQFTENDFWLQKMSRMTYEDHETGEQVPAFDPEALQELIDTGGDAEVRDNEPGEDLRDMFNASIGREREQEYYLPRNLRPRKKFNILEQHSQDREDGKMWVTWCSEKWRDRPLGRMPYQFDLYGKSQYTDMTPLPDLIVSYGDSTPRLLRHLYTMHNLTVAQNFDYITNLLKPFILRRTGVNIEPEVAVRGLFRELVVADLNGIKPLQEPPLPTGAFEREAQIIRMMSIAEPSLTSVDSGSGANPQAGKTATTALLASKAADALTQFKFDGRNRYLRELGAKKLWMNQQGREQQQQWDIEKQYWGDGTRKRVEQLEGPMPDWALTDRLGKVVAIRLDPMQIQADFEVEPEAGSYLAVDDEMRQQAAQNLTQVAMANPDIIDRQKVIRFQMSTIRGIGNPDDYFLQQPPPPPPPQPKVGANITIPLDKMPADIVNQLLPLIGLQPSQALAHKDQMDAVTQAGEAADAADTMMSPGQHEQDQMAQQSDQQHEAAQQSDQQIHEAAMTGLQHGHTLTEQQQQHAHSITEAEQAHGHSMQQGELDHRRTLVQGDQQHRNTMQQGAQAQNAQAQQSAAERNHKAGMQTQQLSAQERQHRAGLQTQEKVAAQKQQAKPNGQGKPNGKANGHAAQPQAAPPAQVLHLKITHEPPKRRRTVKIIRGEDGAATGAEINDDEE
jgi:hypothetical protein